MLKTEGAERTQTLVSFVLLLQSARVVDRSLDFSIGVGTGLEARAFKPLGALLQDPTFAALRMTDAMLYPGTWHHSMVLPIAEGWLTVRDAAVGPCTVFPVTNQGRPDVRWEGISSELLHPRERRRLEIGLGELHDHISDLRSAEQITGEDGELFFWLKFSKRDEAM